MLKRIKKAPKMERTLSVIAFSDPKSCQQCPAGTPYKTSGQQKACK